MVLLLARRGVGDGMTFDIARSCVTVRDSPPTRCSGCDVDVSRYAKSCTVARARGGLATWSDFGGGAVDWLVYRVCG